MGDFNLVSKSKFKLIWRGCVDRPKTPIIHGRKKYLQIRNTHCAWAKIFFHLWLYGEHTTTAMLKLQMNMLNKRIRKQMGGIILFDD